MAIFEKKPQPEPTAEEKKLSHGSGNFNGTYYKIEVRTSYVQPTVVPTGDAGKPFVIDNNWREWPVGLGATPYGTNVPVRGWDRQAAEHGLLSYQVAEAHRWALLAYLDADGWGGSLCVQTRLVAVELHTTYSTKELGVSVAGEYPRRPWDEFKPREMPAKEAAAA